MDGPDKPGHDEHTLLPQVCACSKISHTLAANIGLRPSSFWCVTVAMSLEWITAGVLACLFGLIALLPSFDGNWE